MRPRQNAGMSFKSWRSIGVVLLTGVAAGCATAERIDAAGDVHALMIAIRDDDRARFEAHVDRPALEQELEARILSRTGAADSSDSIRTLGAVLARPLSRLAGDALIRPEVFRSVAEFYGYQSARPLPSQLAIAAALRSLPDGRVCAAKKRDGPCLITFANEQGVWRLVSFDGDVAMLRLP